MPTKQRVAKHCCVQGCKTKSCDKNDIDKIMFRFAEWPKIGMPEFRKAVLIKRFWMWVSVLDVNPSRASYIWICHEHFVTGRPADPFDQLEIDWVPNQNLDCRKRINGNSFLHPDSCHTSGFKPPDGEGCHSQDPDLKGPFCRFCLRKNVNLRALFPSPQPDENQLIMIIEEVACIRLEFAADYNSFVCHHCQQRMEEFFGYRKMWLANNLLLRAFRSKQRCVTPAPNVAIPIEQLMEDSIDEIDPLDGRLHSNEELQEVEQKPEINPNNEMFLAPVPIVVIPIERLMESSMDEIDASLHTNEEFQEVEQKPDLTEQHRCQAYEYLDQNAPIDLQDTKQVLLEHSTGETTLAGDPSSLALCVTDEPHEDAEGHFRESKEKDRLIRKLMRKVRRETFSPKNSKFKDKSRSIQSHDASSNHTNKFGILLNENEI